jgi:hypothetical protein
MGLTANQLLCSLLLPSKFSMNSFKGINTLVVWFVVQLYMERVLIVYFIGGWLRTYREWGGPVLTHAGSNTMNYAVVWAAPKKGACFIVACNLGGDGARQACDEGVKALVDALSQLKL